MIIYLRSVDTNGLLPEGLCVVCQSPLNTNIFYCIVWPYIRIIVLLFLFTYFGGYWKLYFFFNDRLEINIGAICISNRLNQLSEQCMLSFDSSLNLQWTQRNGYVSLTHKHRISTIPIQATPTGPGDKLYWRQTVFNQTSYVPGLWTILPKYWGIGRAHDTTL